MFALELLLQGHLGGRQVDPPPVLLALLRSEYSALGGAQYSSRVAGRENRLISFYSLKIPGIFLKLTKVALLKQVIFHNVRTRNAVWQEY